MIELGDIFRRYGPEYLEQFSHKMLPSHRRAIHDIAKCRNGEFGGHIDTCEKCGYTHLFFHSCSNRSCPKCHASHTQKWLDKRKLTILPVSYFHVVFTLPKELRRIVRSNQTQLLNCLIKAAAYALFKLMADSRFAGGIPGMLSVLHTWSRAMIYHPHVHFLIPAGVISKDKSKWSWLPIKRKKFLVPLPALSSIFRARFIKLARKALPGIEFPQSIWKKQWVVFTKSCTKGGQKVLEYLARYVHRIAITNNRILSVDNGKITFKYQDSTTRHWKKITLPALEFMRRFLQHVLPMGFHKVRYYGFLTPKYRQIFYSLKLSLETSSNQTIATPDTTDKEKGNYYRRCPKCRTGIMVVVVHVFHKKRHILFVRPPPCKK